MSDKLFIREPGGSIVCIIDRATCRVEVLVHTRTDYVIQELARALLQEQAACLDIQLAYATLRQDIHTALNRSHDA